MCCLYVVCILSVYCLYVVCMLSVCCLYIVYILSVYCLYVVCMLSVCVLVQSAGPETFPTAQDKKRQLDRQPQHTDNILTCIKILDKLQKRSYCS